MKRLLVGIPVVVVLLLVAAWLVSRPATPDGFYDRPEAVPEAPGALVRLETWTTGVPAGAEGWRILHTTTRADGSPAVASTLVIAPVDRDDPVPVVAWAHGTTGVARGCAPSLLAEPFGGIPALAAVVEEGWALVATDYVGLGTAGPHAYLEGETAARNVLDSVRAARGITGLALDDRTVVWGHSQGGNTALATAEVAATYAPDVDLIGAVALSPATDLAALLDAAAGSRVGTVLTALTVASWSEAYDDVDLAEVVRPAARALVRDIGGRCVVAPQALLSLGAAVVLGGDVLAVDPTDPPLAGHIAANSTDGRLGVPTLVAQGLADTVVAPTVTDAYVSERCRAGDLVAYHRFAGVDHLPIVLPGSAAGPVVEEWTAARFAGADPPPECTTDDG